MLAQPEVAHIRSGFTLVEILMVIALLALLATSVLPRVGSVFRVNVQSSVRRYAAMVRYAYDQSVLTGRVHRIILDMDKQSWGVEVAEPGALPLDRSKQGVLAEGIREDDRVTSEPSFKKVTGNLVDSFPSGVQIVQVESWRLGKGKVATKGEIGIYAFPNGYIDESTVTLAESGKENGQRFTVTTQPLTGRIKVETVTETPK